MLALAVDAAFRSCAIVTCMVDGAALGAGLLASTALRGMAKLLTLLASKWIGNIGLGGSNLHHFWVGEAVESEAQNAMWAELLDAYYSLWCKITQKLFF